MSKVFLSLSLLAAVVSLACPQGDSNETSADRAPSAPAAGSGIEYEPAYPGEVSGEGLSEGDVAQQEAKHSHDADDDHAHDGGDHDHGEGTDEDHEH